ncbi:MAG: hypothetical protein VKK59_05230 [Vampirovibrionales bacterium]|nr:hypothetical protein [Vampirovibrionales bacterium]
MRAQDTSVYKRERRFNPFHQPRFWRHGLVILIAGLFLCLHTLGHWSLKVHASELPPSVLSTLSRIDPAVRIRFDGLITFSNGERYLPVLPSHTELDATRLVSQDPANAGSPIKPPFPDIMAFDNGLYLLRLVPKAGGRLTLPERANYPFELKTGLLPQDLVLPAGLNIPAELSVILGALEPPPALPTLKGSPTNAPLPPTSSSNPLTVLIPQKSLLLLDLDSQMLLSLNPENGASRWKLNLGCLPSSLTSDTHLDLVFVTCLNTDELLVIDPKAQLIKARVTVGSRPDSVVWIAPELALKAQQAVAPSQDSLTEDGSSAATDHASPSNAVINTSVRKPWFTPWRPSKSSQPTPASPSSEPNRPDASLTEASEAPEANQPAREPSAFAQDEVPKAAQILVSNRFGKTLTVIDTKTLEPVAYVPLPKGSGATTMTLIPALRRIMIADQALGKIYELSLDSWRIKRILPGLQSTSSMAWRPSATEPDGILWMASRASHEIQAVSVASGKILQTMSVGQKPSDLAFGADGQLYVLASQAGVIEVVDVTSNESATLKTSIPLSLDQFAARMTVTSDTRYGYVGLFAKDNFQPVGVSATANPSGFAELVVIDFSRQQVLQRFNLPIQKPMAMLWIQPTP